LGRGGCVFGSSPKRLEQPHPHWCIGGCWFTPAESQALFTGFPEPVPVDNGPLWPETFPASKAS